jgi:hypothetical protein
MFRHTFERGSLRAPAIETPEASGLGDYLELPHEEDAPHADKPAEKSDVEKQIEGLRKDFERVSRELGEAKQDSKYWADRARKGGDPAAPGQPDDDEEEDTLPASPFAGEKAEKLLDDLSVEGLSALLKRGVPTKEELASEIAKIQKRITKDVEQRLEKHTRDTSMDAKFNDFPEIISDSKLVAEGLAPKTELYKRTAILFKQMVEDDPNLKNSTGATLAAARMAKKELALEAKEAKDKETTAPDRQAERRRRIAAQGGERSPAGGTEDEPGNDELTATQREVIGNLSKYLTVRDGKGKVTVSAEENYRRNMKAR